MLMLSLLLKRESLPREMLGWTSRKVLKVVVEVEFVAVDGRELSEQEEEEGAEWMSATSSGRRASV